MNIAVPASEPSIVKNVVSAEPSVPLKRISESLAAASIVILPDVVVKLIAASPALRSSAASELELAAANVKFPPPSVFKK